MASTKMIDIRRGMVLNMNGQLMYCLDRDLNTPGNWRAILYLKLKNLKTGDKVLMNNGIYGIIANVKEKSFIVKIADNVKIESVGANAEVTFRWGIDDPASAFKLQSSTTVGSGYADATATIARTGPGTYKATIARSGAARFYRIRLAQ